MSQYYDGPVRLETSIEVTKASPSVVVYPFLSCSLITNKQNSDLAMQYIMHILLFVCLFVCLCVCVCVYVCERTIFSNAQVHSIEWWEDSES